METIGDTICNEDRICRVCSNTDELKSIFKTGKILNETVTLSSLLKDLLAFEISKDDGLPGFMCKICVMQLVKATNFKQKCINAYDQFKEKEIQICIEDESGWFLETKNSQESIPISIIQVEEEVAAECIDANIDRVVKTDMSFEDTTFEDDPDTNSGKPVIFRQYKNRSKKIQPPFQCNECGKILSKLSSYKYHMNLHSDTPRFECKYCDEKFKTKNAYEGHMTIHNGQFSCEICSKSYRQEASLKSHMLSHTGERPFKCDICGKGMTQKSGWKKHMLTHSDTKMYDCNICGKQFRVSSNLIVHMRIHSGDKPYECDVCSKKFISKEQLKRHCLIHTGLKPFVCGECGKAFNRRSVLVVHMRSHNPEKKFKCEICQKGFNQLHNFNIHKTTCGKPKKEVS